MVGGFPFRSSDRGADQAIPTESDPVGSGEFQFERPGRPMRLAALVAFGVVAWCLQGCRPNGAVKESPRPIGVDAAGDIVSRTNVALGWLENQSLGQAIPAFEKLSSEVPQESLPARNLAVARTVALGERREACQPGGADAPKRLLGGHGGGDRLRLLP